MTETGTETATATETGDTVTGSYTHIENGTDVYTLGETGTLSGAFSDSVIGTDNYASTETGNHAMQTYSGTTTGGGTWTRTANGGTLSAGSGTNAYTLADSGDSAAGHFSQSETGTDRYGLVQSFDDVSNANGGTTPGNVTFHSEGLPFRDPTPTKIWEKLTLEAKKAWWSIEHNKDNENADVEKVSPWKLKDGDAAVGRVASYDKALDAKVEDGFFIESLLTNGDVEWRVGSRL